MTPDPEAIRRAARSRRADYALDATPLGSGGQAEVFRAVHKPTDQPVAFKRLLGRSGDAVARMQREIEVARHLDHPNVLPVLDHGSDGDWFVMPLAVADLSDQRVHLAEETRLLRDMLKEVCDALNEAHRHGYVHRDIKPANVLLVQPRPRRWALADWGLVRRPPGYTTDPGRTRVGMSYGTEGFAAPELSVDAHGAGPSADVYSLGQLVGWALTGKWPLPNVSLLPRKGPWRTVVREATRSDPRRRPQSAADFARLVREELDLPPLLPSEVGEQLVARARARDMEAATDLFDLADRNPEDHDLHIDVLPQLPAKTVKSAVRGDPERAARLAAGMAGHLEGDWGYRNFKWADEVIMWLFRMVESAQEIPHWDLFDTAVEAMFDWDDHWDQWAPQDRIRPWLRTLDGEAARIVARSLRRHLNSIRHFSGLADDLEVDRAVRSALNA